MESALSAITDDTALIQPATWRDVNAVNQLERACFPKDAWPIWDIVGVLTLPNVIRLKAVHKEKIIGFAAVDKRPIQKIAWIATICVQPEYRRQGIGSALLQACENSVNLPSIRLSVRASNRGAIDLYQRHGYKQMEVWLHYYPDREDAIVLGKKLR